MKKTTDPSRQVLIELVLGVAVCAAGFFFTVDSTQKSIAKARDEITALTAQAAEQRRPPVPADKADSVIKEATAKIKTIQDRSALAKDQSALFSALMELAGSHRIRVDQLQPVTVGNKRTASKPAAPPPPPPPSGSGTGPLTPAAPQIESACVRYAIAATGSYADLARFVGALQFDLGFTRVRSVRIDPVRESSTPIVQVLIETEHYAFGAGAVASAQAISEGRQ